MSILGIIVLVFVVLFIFIFNSLIMKRNMVDNSMALVDAYLKKRFDLIPNLVAAASQYMKHESETLSKIAEMRANAKSVAEKSSLDCQLTGTLRNFMVQVESYPDLKASENVMHLQRTLNEIEEQLAAARRTYNSSVTDFNNAIQMVPGCFFAPMMRLSKRELFTIPENEKANVDVNALFNR
ncbi:MAG: LemA family protein [Lentisphaerae bacterium]|nr:LemA family protein [Lentisphaerota bacterium]